MEAVRPTDPADGPPAGAPRTPAPSPDAPEAATGAAVLAAMQALASGQRIEPALRDELRASAPLMAEVVMADAAARMAEIGCAQIRDLDARVTLEAPDQPLLHWWVIAILGERAFLDADLGAIPLAIQALAEVPA